MHILVEETIGRLARGKALACCSLLLGNTSLQWLCGVKPVIILVWPNHAGLLHPMSDCFAHIGHQQILLEIWNVKFLLLLYFPVCMFIHLSFHLSLCPFVCVHPSGWLSAYLSICLSIHLCIFIHLSIRLYVFPPWVPSIQLSVCPLVCPSVCVSICCLIRDRHTTCWFPYLLWSWITR